MRSFLMVELSLEYSDMFDILKQTNTAFLSFINLVIAVGLLLDCVNLESAKLSSI